MRLQAVAAAILLGTLIGCTGGGSAPPAAGGSPKDGKEPLRIAVIPKGTTHEFWKSVHYGAEQAAKEVGNVEILWKGPLQENDRDGQISVVQDFITKKVDGIVLAPLDSQALVPYVKEAQQHKIPTVIFDSALDDEGIIVSYVATDNRNGGALAARRLAEVLDKKGNVILLRYNAGSESTLQREDGFLETLAKEFPDIKVISSTEYAGTTPEAALDKSQQVLIKYKDEVNGVFTVCEPNSTGMLGALEEQKLAGKVHFVAFDPSPRFIEAMREKKIDGIVLQDPVRMGYLAVKTLHEHLQGKPVEKRIPTGEFMATPENMDEPDMHKLLNPPQF